jgi:hypothetical protein
MIMNRRGKRITLGVMAIALAVVLVLAIAHSVAVRDHVEAWHFQLTRATEAIEPDPNLRGVEALIDYSTSGPPNGTSGVNSNGQWYEYWPDAFLSAFANYRGCPVIFELGGPSDWPLLETQGPVTAEMAGDILRRIWACRIIDQRLPRRACIVICPFQETLGRLHREKPPQ